MHPLLPGTDNVVVHAYVGAVLGSLAFVQFGCAQTALYKTKELQKSRVLTWETAQPIEWLAHKCEDLNSIRGRMSGIKRMSG